MHRVKLLLYFTWASAKRAVLRLKANKMVLSAIALLLLLAGYFLLIYKDGLFKPSVSEGVVGTYTENDLPESVTGLLSQSLIKIDKNGTPRGDLVASWETDKDAKNYTFKLKNNLRWSDGTQLKASDLDLKLPSDVTTEVKDDKTLLFKINESFSPFPAMLTKPVLKLNSNLGTGLYKIVEVKKDSIFVKKIRLRADRKDLPDVVFRFYPSEKIAKNALRIGEVQSLVGISEIEDLKKDKTLSLWSKTNYNQIVTIFYNTKDAILSDDNFRLTLSFAAPSLKEETEAVTSIPPGSWAFNPSVKDYLDNPEQAENYWGRVKNGKDQTVVLTATSSLKATGERVVEAWRKNGINAELRVESGIPQNFQALLIAQNIPSDPDQYSLWHSTQTQTNISKVSNPRIDKDLEDGRKSADLDIRKARYQDFQKVLLDHSPATFLYFSKYNVVYLKKIENNLKKVLNLQLQ